MQLVDHFNVLLKETVNLSQVKLALLDDRVEAIFRALKSDSEIGSLIIGKTPQGSWAHRTIINPLGNKEFDADFMLNMRENPDWSKALLPFALRFVSLDALGCRKRGERAVSRHGH